MLSSLRSQYHAELEEIYGEIEALVKRYEKQCKSNYFVCQFVGGLKKIKRSVWRVLNYHTSDENYWQLIGVSAIQVNILFNMLEGGVLKDAALRLYERLCKVLDDDFQLNLFSRGDEFGWGGNRFIGEDYVGVLDGVKKCLSYWTERDYRSNKTRYDVWLNDHRWQFYKHSWQWRSVEGDQLCLDLPEHQPRSKKGSQDERFVVYVAA